MLTEHLLYAKCHAMLFIFPAKQKVDICIFVLQIGTVKLLDVKLFAEIHIKPELKLQVRQFPNHSLSLHHQILFSKGIQFNAPEYLSTNVSMTGL